MSRAPATVALKNFTRQPLKALAGLPYPEVATARLPGWEISLAFVGRARAENLNRQLRGKTYVPNVLSYVVGRKSGEIIICLSEAERQAPQYGLTRNQFVLYLFIHGILHLEGRAHGATMEQWEQKLLARYAVALPRIWYEPAHRDGHRHRHLPD